MAAVFDGNELITIEEMKQRMEARAAEQDSQFQRMEEHLVSARDRVAASVMEAHQIQKDLESIGAKLERVRAATDEQEKENQRREEFLVRGVAQADEQANELRELKEVLDSAIARGDKIIAQSREHLGGASASYSSPMLTGATLAKVAAAPWPMAPENALENPNVESSSSEPEFWV